MLKYGPKSSHCSFLLQAVDEQQQQPPGVNSNLPEGPGHEAGQPGEGGGGAAHSAASGGSLPPYVIHRNYYFFKSIFIIVTAY